MRRFFMKTLATLLMSVPLLAAAACAPTSGKDEDKEQKEYIQPEGYVLLTSGDATGVQSDGVGVEFDPLFWSHTVPWWETNGQKTSEEAEELWATIEKRIAALNVKNFRVMLNPSWIEKYNDNDDPYNTDLNAFDFDSVETQSVCRVLDIAQKYDIRVTLVLWGVPLNKSLASDNYVSSSYWMASNHSGSTAWMIGPKGDAMIAEFCENFSVYTKYLLETKGYTCIKEVTPINEPDGQYIVDGVGNQYGEYVKLCIELDRRFSEDGIRDKVEFNLSDTTFDRSREWLPQVAEDLTGIADKLNAHCYGFGSETPNSTMNDWYRFCVETASDAGMRFFVGELGGNKFVSASRQGDIDAYERGVFLARTMINGLNAGVSGFSYWIAHDCFYNKNASYAEMQQLGLWMSIVSDYAGDETYEGVITEDLQVRDQYYAYGLVSGSVGLDSSVYPVALDEEFVSATRVVTEGKDVWLLANQNTVGFKEYCFRVDDDEWGNKYSYVVYQSSSLPEGDTLLQETEELSVMNGYVSFTLPPNSVVAIKEK